MTNVYCGWLWRSLVSGAKNMKCCWSVSLVWRTLHVQAEGLLLYKKVTSEGPSTYPGHVFMNICWPCLNIFREDLGMDLVGCRKLGILEEVINLSIFYWMLLSLTNHFSGHSHLKIIKSIIVCKFCIRRQIILSRPRSYLKEIITIKKNENKTKHSMMQQNNIMNNDK